MLRSTLATIALLGVVSSSHGQAIGTLDHEKERILSVSFSSDGSFVVSGSDKGNVRLWDVHKRKCVRTVPHEMCVRALLFADGDKKIAVASEEKVDGIAAPCVFILDASTGKLLRKLSRCCSPIAISPDGQTLACCGGDKFAEVQGWNVLTGEQVFVYRGHRGSPQSVAFSSDGKRLASALEKLRIWDLTAKKQEAALVGLPDVVRQEVVHAKLGINCVAFSPDGRFLATSAMLLNVKMWDARALKEYMSLNDFSLDRPVPRTTCLGFTPDSKHLAVANGSVVEFWKWDDKEIVCKFVGHKNTVNSLSVTRKGDMMATGSSDGTVKLWKLPH